MLTGRPTTSDDRLDRRDRALDLLLLGKLLKIRPRRHAADVDDVGPFGLEPLRLLDRRLDAVDAVTRERLRRDVDDAHDVGARAPLEDAVADRHGRREITGHTLIVGLAMETSNRITRVLHEAQAAAMR